MNFINQNRACLFVSLLLVVPFLSAQVVQQGVVTEISSNRQAIAGVAILANGAQPTDSDMKGCFELNFPQAFPGDLLLVQRIYKKGYELVNDNELNHWGVTAEKKMNIVLARKGYLEESRQKYYHIGVTASQKRYQTAIEKLHKERMAEQINEQAYNQKIDSLNMSLQAFNEKLHLYANKFARINRDQLDETEKEALKLIDEGKIEEAIGIYEKMNLTQRMKERTDIRDSARRNLSALEPALLNELKLLQNNHPNGQQMLRIDTIYQTLTRSFPEKTTYGFEYAKLLIRKEKYTEALEEYNVLLKPLIILCSSSEIGEIKEQLVHLKQLPAVKQSDMLNDKIKAMEKRVDDALHLVQYKKSNELTK